MPDFEADYYRADPIIFPSVRTSEQYVVTDTGVQPSVKPSLAPEPVSEKVTPVTVTPAQKPVIDVTPDVVAQNEPVATLNPSVIQSEIDKLKGEIDTVKDIISRYQIVLKTLSKDSTKYRKVSEELGIWKQQLVTMETRLKKLQSHDEL